VAVTNWAGNVRFAAACQSAPGSLEALQELVAAQRRVRVLGAGHSFSPVADTTGVQVSLRSLVRPPVIEPEAARAWVSAGATYAEVAVALHDAGWGLANLASLPHVTVAGACATATHGSGTAKRCLAGAVRGLELVGPGGELAVVDADADRLAGSVVSLGALGVVTRLCLDIEPTYQVAQQVWLGVPLQAAAEHLGELLGCGDSVSLFIDWAQPDLVSQVWVKRRVGTQGTDTPGELGGRLSPMPVHPITGSDPAATTTQGGVPGPWHERLPHFLASAVPSNGEELQSEWLVPAAAGADALGRLRGLASRLAGLVQVCEIRAVAADELWLSPAYGRASVGLHVTWRNDPAAVAALLPIVEAALQPLDPRPHWGKLFSMPPEQVAAALPRFADAQRLIDAADPDRVFANDFVDAYLRR
jgi:xylitol oxidase